MPIGVSNDIKQEVQKKEYRFVYLYEVDSNTHGTEYYTSANGKVIVNGIEYTPIDIKYTNISREMASKIERVELKITYVGLDFSSAQDGDYDGCEVRIYLHFPDIPDSKELYFKGYIEGFVIDRQNIKIELVPVTDYMSFTIPKRRYETKCPWKFGDDNCLLPDNYVLKEDGSVDMICDLEKHNTVVSSKKIGYIRNVIPKHYSGDIIKIKSYYLPYELKVTPDHPILAVKNEELRCEKYPTKKRRKIHIFVDHYSYCKYCLMPPPKPNFICAGDICSGDFVGISFNREVCDIEYFDLAYILRKIRQPYILEGDKIKLYRKYFTKEILLDRYIPITEDLLLFIGYFLAEGSLGQSVISFSFHKDELDYIEDVLRLCKSIFGLDGKVVDKKNSKCRVVNFYSKLLVCFFYYVTGKLALRKKLCKELMLLPPEKQVYILQGLFRGDGFLKRYTGKDGVYGVGWTTASRDLAWQIWTILLRNGVVPTFRKHSNENNYVHTIIINSKDGNKFSNFVFGCDSKYRDYSFKEAFIKDGIFFFKVRKVEKINYNGTVYDLQIADSDNTFVANGIVVHNCGYVGAGGPCDKTLDTCLNPSRFGGFPWIKVK